MKKRKTARKTAYATKHGGTAVPAKPNKSGLWKKPRVTEGRAKRSTLRNDLTIKCTRSLWRDKDKPRTCSAELLAEQHMTLRLAQLAEKFNPSRA